MSTNKAGRIGFVSLGCPKALVDSERILTQLRAEGYETVAAYQDADLVVVNTCGFIDEAVDESLAAIGEAMAENGRVVVTGCLGARPDTITRVHPGVLSVTGPHNYEAVMSAIHEHLPPPHDPFLDLLPAQGIKLTPRHYAYLKISEGCNNRCTFCIIPALRGRLASRSIGDVMQEAERLVKSGVQELLVISQDTSAYGSDLRYQADEWRGRSLETRFLSLCEALGELGVWVRLHYVYPYPHVDKVIPLMASGAVLPYLDIPFQHANQRILRLMRRPAHAENTLDRIHRWREACPDLTLRSTFIVGFPGESEREFEELLDWLEEARLDRVGCFKYSPVQGAAANDLGEPVDEDVKEDRWQRFMQVAAGISAERLAEKVGREMTVLVDEVDRDGDLAIARGPGDAPEIDGRILVEGGAGLAEGAFVRVKIASAETYDLLARIS
ncbi:MAG: ribosomal protein S12 methylthiotransferase RimO [Gammaproteobacteria bacterium SG8_31]|nr:MAG: ribosomal protein S12 methylthiotransferase RimO [Gammaproteobacteria bacterium SG8_31]